MEPNPLEYSFIGDKRPELIHIIQAESGAVCDYEFYRLVGQNVTTLQTIIENEFSVPKSNQIILKKDGTQLEARMVISKVLSANTTLYVFNHEFYSKKADLDDYNLLPAPVSLQKKWSESTHNYIFANYEHHFEDFRKCLDDKNKVYYDKIASYYTDCKEFVKQGTEIFHMICRQGEAETCAKNNLLKYFDEKNKVFLENIEKANERLKEASPLIENLNQHVKTLKATKVDPLLETESKKVLFDYFDEKKIADLSQVCLKNQQKILQKFSGFKDEISIFKFRVENLKENINPTGNKVQDLVQKKEALIKDLFHKRKKFSRKLYSKVMVEKEGRNPAKEKLTEFGKTQSELIGKQVKELQLQFREIMKNIEAEILGNKNKLKEFIAEISSIQKEIRDGMSIKVRNFNALIDKHKKDTTYIEILDKFPKAYETCLVEIKRRGEFKKNYLGLLNALDKYTAYETESREKFMRDHNSFIPATFCPFLSNKFPKLNVEEIVSHIEEDLPLNIQNKVVSEENEKIYDFVIMFEKQHKLIENKTTEYKKLEEELKALKSNLNHKPETSLTNVLADQLKLYEQNFSHFVREKVGNILINKLDSKLVDHQKKLAKLEALIKSKIPEIIKKAGDDRSALQRLNKSHDQLNKSHEQLNRDYQQLVKSGEAQTKALDASLNSLVTKNKELEATNKSLLGQLANKKDVSSSEDKIKNLEELLHAYQMQLDERMNLEDSSSFKFNKLAKENEELKKDLAKMKEEKAILKEKLDSLVKQYNEKLVLLKEAEKISTEVYSFFIAKLPPEKQDEFWTKEYSIDTIKEIFNAVMMQSIDFNKGEKVKINSPEPKDRVLMMKTEHNHWRALTQFAGCKAMFLLGKDGLLFADKSEKKFRIAVIKTIEVLKDAQAVHKLYKINSDEVYICLFDVEEAIDFEI